jgi:hypothetical protein
VERKGEVQRKRSLMGVFVGLMLRAGGEFLAGYDGFTLCIGHQSKNAWFSLGLGWCQNIERVGLLSHAIPLGRCTVKGRKKQRKRRATPNVYYPSIVYANHRSEVPSNATLISLCTIYHIAFPMQIPTLC